MIIAGHFASSKNPDADHSQFWSGSLRNYARIWKSSDVVCVGKQSLSSGHKSIGGHPSFHSFSVYTVRNSAP